MEAARSFGTSLVVWTALLASSCPAQQPSNGPLVGLPISITVLPGTRNLAGTPLSNRELYHKKAGVGAPTPIAGAWHPNTPDYSFATLFDAGGSSTYDLQLGATSAGLDYVATDSTGRYAEVPAGSWNVLTFTVGPTTIGKPGGVVAQEATAPDGAAADVFTYGILGSDGMPMPFVGTVQRALDSTEIDVYFPGNATTPRAKGQIGTLDFGMTYYSLDPAVRSHLQGVYPVSEARFYFTIAKPSLTVAPAAWFGGAANKSAATILMRSWSTSTRAWSTAGVFLSYGSLGLAISDAVDALAVNPEGSKVLFSTVKTSTTTISQLRFARVTPTIVSVYDYEYNGVVPIPVAGEIGIETDGDLKEICIVDPRIYSYVNQVAQPPIGQHLFAGLSAPPTLGLFPISLAATIHRSYDAAGAATLDSWMTGWAPSGPGGGAYYLVEVPPQNSFNFVVLPVTRNPSTPLPGSPTHVELLLPPPYYTAFQGTVFRSFWIALNGAGANAIGTSYMTSIVL